MNYAGWEITVEFSKQGLWGPDDPAEGGYDEKASAEKFAAMLEKAIGDEYPGANVEVAHGINDKVVVYDEQDMPDDEEAAWVNQTVENVYQTFSWMV